MIRSTAASARRTIPPASTRTAAAWPKRSASPAIICWCRSRSIPPIALQVDAPFAQEERPRCDGLVTATRGLGLGVTGADCGIILFADAERQIIGAGPRRLEGRPDRRARSHHRCNGDEGRAAGRHQRRAWPDDQADSYEVGPEFFARFLDASQDYANFFKPSARAGHFMFDLPRFIGARVKSAGICQFESCGVDTYADEARCFSYRRSVHRNEPDYGRLIAAIALV